MSKKFRPKQDVEDSIDNYVRIGSDYFRILEKIDRFGVIRTELKTWKKDEIKTDFGPDAFKVIKKYADFALEPSNSDYQPLVHNCYNLYRKFSHQPKEGSTEWSMKLMKHIFGDQIELGMRYLQILYLHPRHMAPILVLVSRERQTGKTTFVNWLNMIFGANMVIISPEDLQGQFNHSYATSNIIAVEETLIEKAIMVEKIKSLATCKFITVNQKFVNHFKVPFYGKIILTSNNEDKFARIDDEEIRFFIRKVGYPKESNHFIEDKLVSEIPAFLHHLTTLSPVDFSVDRSGFTPAELSNDSLLAVKKESKSWLYKSLKMLIEDLFLNSPYIKDEFKADPLSIKERWFKSDSRVDLAFIRSTLKNEFKLIASEKTEYFAPFEEGQNKSARSYTFLKDQFLLVVADDKDKKPEVEISNEEVIPF